jgi:hypothetical protein
MRAAGAERALENFGPALMLPKNDSTWLGHAGEWEQRIGKA